MKKIKVAYDNYYQTENLFGDPYPELIEFFASCPKNLKILDLGCGQGRNTIALGRLGFSVTGIDNSTVGIEQMIQIAQSEKLNIVGLIDDIYAFDRYDEFELILLDSMFHFAKKDREKEINLIKKIVSEVKEGCLIIVCIQDSGKKVNILNESLDFEKKLSRLADRKFKFTFEDKKSGYKTETDYRMIISEK